MTWCHHYHITLKARHISGCLNVMANLLSRSNQVQSTEWSLYPQVFKQICQKWFTPHVDLFGVSVDQIMQACHWKAHNTFKKFYLKDLTWSHNDNNMYLGPVVAAQQVLDPSPQTSHPRKERKGGGGGGGHIHYSQVFRSLIPGSRYRFTFQDVTGKVILYF